MRYIERRTYFFASLLETTVRKFELFYQRVFLKYSNLYFCEFLFSYSPTISHYFLLRDVKNREVEYAEKQEIVDGIVAKYHPEWLESEKAEPKGYESGGQAQVQSEYNQPAKILEKITEGKKDKDGKGGSGKMLQEIAPHNRTAETEVNSDGQA